MSHRHFGESPSNTTANRSLPHILPTPIRIIPTLPADICILFTVHADIWVLRNRVFRNMPISHFSRLLFSGFCRLLPPEYFRLPSLGFAVLSLLRHFLSTGATAVPRDLPVHTSQPQDRKILVLNGKYICVFLRHAAGPGNSRGFSGWAVD